MPLYEKYDELSFLGALTTSDGGINMTVDGDPFKVPVFTEANMTAIRPLLTIGGWAGSQFVSLLCDYPDAEVYITPYG